MKIIKGQKSVSFLSGILVAAFLFLLSRSYKERRGVGRVMTLFLARLGVRRYSDWQEAAIFTERKSQDCGQPSAHLEAFLKTYQPEILATLIHVLRMAHIPLEAYFEALEAKEDWHKFGELMGEVSLMIFEQSRIPEGAGKERAIFEVRERYIPKLIKAIENFKAAFA